MRESHGIAGRITQKHHPAYDYDRGDKRRDADVHQFAERETQPHGEEQENNADVAPYLDVCRVGNRREKGYMWPGHDAGHDISEDDGLFDPAEEDRDESGYY